MINSVNKVEQSNIIVDLRHAIVMIARALDFVGIDDIHHGHRVAYIALECARRLNWSEKKCQFTYFSGLLHDCGVSTTDEHLRLLSGLQPQGSESHCIRGELVLNNCSTLSRYSTVVRYHHTPWSQLKKLNMSDLDEDVSALIFLADRVDFLRANYLKNSHPNLITLYEELIAENILANSGVLFNSEMAEAMATLVSVDGFWYSMQAENIEQIATSFKLNREYDKQLSIDEVNQLASFLANIVDAKSPFTFLHSIKVAVISRQLAKDMGLTKLIQQHIYIAGLLHDVGKLKVEDRILHKEGPLTNEEYSHIKRHSIDTRDTLRGFFPGMKIGEWASNHHERLDGSGYPYHMKAHQLDQESRIIAVADVFQALSQKRPYRGILKLSEIFNIMDPLIKEQKLDGEIYQYIKTNDEKYYKLSTDINCEYI